MPPPVDDPRREAILAKLAVKLQERELAEKKESDFKTRVQALEEVLVDKRVLSKKDVDDKFDGLPRRTLVQRMLGR